MCLAVHKTTGRAHFQNEVLPPLQSVYQRECRIIPINQPWDFKPWDFKPWGFSAFRDLKILLESLHILGEGDPALVGNSA